MEPQTNVPDWAAWVQAFGPTLMSFVTTLVAIAVATIAYRQWRTAREKLVLDLFERRYKVYDLAKAGVNLAMQHGDTNDNDSIRMVAMARNEAVFLFGPDVQDYLAKLQRTMAELGLARTQLAAGNTDSDWSQLSHDASHAIYAFYDAFPKIAADYMRMDQKL